MTGVFRIITTVCALFLSAVAAGASERVTVFAAASLKEALDAVAAAYPGEVAISYGGSGAIARQVAQGAPADIVILANPAWMGWLEGKGSIDPRSRLTLLENSLVLIGPAGALPLAQITPEALLARLGDGRLAMGHRAAVPAGIYARQWLENIGAWGRLAPHLAETDNVRAALVLVARGEAPLGVVYRTDARVGDVVTLYDIPDGMHDRVQYPVAMTSFGTGVYRSEFMKFLISDSANAIFRAHGFVVPEGGS